MQRAYDLPALFAQGNEGQGQTIAIVDSFGSPTIQQDLDMFDQAYGLPTPKLTVIQPAGAVRRTTRPTPTMIGWAGETNLDVEWAHAMAPKANILLVETPTSENEGTTGFPEIVTAEKYVVDHHLAAVISQSFSATEETFPSQAALLALRGAYQDAYANHVTVLAASGDSGAADADVGRPTLYPHPVTSWPDSDPLVTGVGGTKLKLDANGNHTSRTWSGTTPTTPRPSSTSSATTVPTRWPAVVGSRLMFDRPAYQDRCANVVGDQRGVPDISMSGACNGAVNVYQSFHGQPAGWYPTCGTSEATPLFAGIVALAAQRAGHPLGLINPALYFMSESARAGPGGRHVGQQHGVVHPGRQAPDRPGLQRAAPGYDLASGVGTVDAAKFVPELASYVERALLVRTASKNVATARAAAFVRGDGRKSNAWCAYGSSA